MSWFIMLIGWAALGVCVWGVFLLRKRTKRQEQQERLRSQLFLVELERERKP